MQKIVPAKLAAGDEIRVVAPARGIRIIGQESREIAAQRFAALGLKVSFGSNTTDENWDMTGSSPIEDRIADIHEAFADKNVKAVFTIIGGANSNQLLPYLDYELIKANPKIFCGFSDIYRAAERHLCHDRAGNLFRSALQFFRHDARF